MAALDLQEQEQLDALRSWWRGNGKGVILVIVVAVSAFAGTQLWQWYQSKQASEAAELYASLTPQLNSGDPKRVNDPTQTLMDKYASSAYTPRAALAAAQININANEITQARAQLEWVAKNAKEEGMQSVARLKLAALLLDQKDYAGAMTQLDGKHPEAYEGLFADLKGDVYNAQGKVAEARVAYQTAFDKMDIDGPYRNLVQMKLDGLGEAK